MRDLEKKREYQREWSRKKFTDPEAREHRRKLKREWDRKNKDSERQKAAARINLRREEHNEARRQRLANNREKLKELKSTLCCVVCGEDEPCTFDFHHLDPTTKEDNIASLVGSLVSWGKVQEEIDKCIVLCANCHRKLHAGIINI